MGLSPSGKFIPVSPTLTPLWPADKRQPGHLPIVDESFTHDP
jgi:hypothetical protein